MSGIIIRLQRLPWSANAADIREFFKGLSIPEGGVHIVGGRDGDAFIAFDTDEDAMLAMRIENKRIQGTKVKLLLSSRAEMSKVIEKARGDIVDHTAATPQHDQHRSSGAKHRSRSRSRERSFSPQHHRRNGRERPDHRPLSRPDLPANISGYSSFPGTLNLKPDNAEDERSGLRSSSYQQQRGTWNDVPAQRVTRDESWIPQGFETASNEPARRDAHNVSREHQQGQQDLPFYGSAGPPMQRNRAPVDFDRNESQQKDSECLVQQHNTAFPPPEDYSFPPPEGEEIRQSRNYPATDALDLFGCGSRGSPADSGRFLTGRMGVESAPFGEFDQNTRGPTSQAYDRGKYTQDDFSRHSDRYDHGVQQFPRQGDRLDQVQQPVRDQSGRFDLPFILPFPRQDDQTRQLHQDQDRFPGRDTGRDGDYRTERRSYERPDQRVLPEQDSGRDATRQHFAPSFQKDQQSGAGNQPFSRNEVGPPSNPLFSRNERDPLNPPPLFSRTDGGTANLPFARKEVGSAIPPFSRNEVESDFPTFQPEQGILPFTVSQKEECALRPTPYQKEQLEKPFPEMTQKLPNPSSGRRALLPEPSAATTATSDALKPAVDQDSRGLAERSGPPEFNPLKPFGPGPPPPLGQLVPNIRGSASIASPGVLDNVAEGLGHTLLPSQNAGPAALIKSPPKSLFAEEIPFPGTNPIPPFQSMPPISQEEDRSLLNPSFVIVSRLPSRLHRYNTLKEFFYPLNLRGRDAVKMIMGIDKHGKPYTVGEAYLRFQNSDDCRKAMEKNGQEGIRILPCSESDFNKAVDGLPEAPTGPWESLGKEGRGRFPTVPPPRLSQGDGRFGTRFQPSQVRDERQPQMRGRFVVHMSNLPYRVEEAEVMAMLGQLKPVFARKVFRPDGTPSDEWFAEFEFEQDARAALALNLVVKGRGVVLRQSSVETMDAKLKTMPLQQQPPPFIRDSEAPRRPPTDRRTGGSLLGQGPEPSPQPLMRQQDAQFPSVRGQSQQGRLGGSLLEKPPEFTNGPERGGQVPLETGKIQPNLVGLSMPGTDGQRQILADPANSSSFERREESFRSYNREEGRTPTSHGQEPVRRNREFDSGKERSFRGEPSRFHSSRGSDGRYEDRWDNSRDNRQRERSPSRSGGRSSARSRSPIRDHDRKRRRDSPERFSSKRRSNTEEATTASNTPTSTLLTPPVSKPAGQLQLPKHLCVLITGMPHTITERDVASFFQGIRIATNGIRLMKDPKGSAFVEFATLEAAGIAVRKDGGYMGSKMVSVKPSSKEDMTSAVQKQFAPAFSFTGPSSQSAIKGPPKLPTEPLVQPHVLAASILEEHSSASAESQQQQQNLRKEEQPKKVQRVEPIPVERKPPPIVYKSPPPPPGVTPIDPEVVMGIGQPGRVVAIHGLPPRISLEELCQFFSGNGQIVDDSVRMHYNDVGEPTGDCLLAMTDADDAKKATCLLNEQVLSGYTVRMYVVPVPGYTV